MIYLASPYSHPDPKIMQERFRAAAEITAELIKRGKIIYSPIVHNHYLACNFDLPRDAGFWLKYDFGILRRCDFMLVLTLDGWQESNGVSMEIKYCKENYIAIEYIKPAEWIVGKDNRHSNGGLQQVQQ